MKLFIHKYSELIVTLLILLVGGIIRGYNMLHYPAYFDDEGTYVAQAWAFLTQDKLSHYTYWYDHPPLGWIQLAIFSFISGGFNHFGFALNSGRVLMLLLSIGCAFFIYKIARNFGIQRFASIIGTLLFIFSPLSIAMDRMIFLDNIMIFWVLASIWLLSINKERLLYVTLSAISLGIAILSKETALIIIPVCLYCIYVKMKKQQRILSLVIFFFITISMGSLWILYAVLNNELVPPGWLFTNPNIPHVSLIGAIHDQLSRGGHGSIFSPGSDIRISIYRWLTGKLSLFEGVPDVILIILGFVSLVSNALFGLISKQKRYLLVSLLGVFFILFLIRGGIVLVFYIIGLLPILALNIVFTLQLIVLTFDKLKHKIASYVIKALIISVISITYIYYNLHGLKTVLLTDQTSANIKAVAWVIKNVPKNDIVLTDDYAYIDLKNSNFLSPNPVYYWKAQLDPSVNWKVLKNDWRNIDYLLTTPSFRADLNSNVIALPTLKKAYENSTKVAGFSGANFYEVAIYKVNKPNDNKESHY